MFRETTTLGVRYHDVEREVLAREIVAVTTPWGAVPVKVARLRRRGHQRGAGVRRRAWPWPARHGVPVKDVQAAAMKAWLDRA